MKILIRRNRQKKERMKRKALMKNKVNLIGRKSLIGKKCLKKKRTNMEILYKTKLFPRFIGKEFFLLIWKSIKKRPKNERITLFIN